MSKTTTIDLDAFKSAAKNPLADITLSVAVTAAKIRRLTDNQLTHRHIDMDDLARDLSAIDAALGYLVDDIEKAVR